MLISVIFGRIVKMAGRVVFGVNKSYKVGLYDTTKNPLYYVIIHRKGGFSISSRPA